MNQDDISHFSLIDIIAFIKRRSSEILLSGLLVAFLAGIIALLMQPIYQAQTAVLINVRQANTLDTVALLPGQGGDAFAVDSELEIIKSPGLLRAVAKKENLHQREDFYKQKPSLLTLAGIWLGVHEALPLEDTTSVTELKETEAKKLATNDDIKNTATTTTTATVAPSIVQDWLQLIFPAPVANTPEILDHKILEKLQNNLDVKKEGRSYVVTISYDSPDPALATQIVNSIANEYLNSQLEVKQNSTKRATAWLDDRLGGLRKELEVKEEAIARFKEKHNLYGATGITQIERQLTNLNEQLVTARVDTAEKQARYNQVRLLAKSGSLQSYSGFNSSGTVTNLRAQEAIAQENVADLSARYGKNHPNLINAQAKLRNIKSQVNKEAGRMTENAHSEYRIAVSREQSLANNLAKLKRAFDKTGSQAIRLQKLEREAETAKMAFNGVAENFRKTDETDKIQESDAQIISPAVAPLEPVKPKKMIIVVAGFIIGLLLGTAIVLLRELLIKGYITVARLEQETNHKVLASVVYLNAKTLKLDGKQVPIDTYLARNPLSIFAESLYRVRVVVEANTRLTNDPVNAQNKNNIVMLTSSISGEGKTTLSLSYAISAAKAGKKVVLLDTDFRRPTLTKNFLPSIPIGLAEYLSDAKGHSVDELINPTSTDNLSFIGIKECPSHPADLLKSVRFTALVEHLRNHYDLVVVDTPPLSAVIDGRVIADYADHILYTVAWEATPREIVLDSLNVLPDSLREKISGIILNKIFPKKEEKYGYNYGYQYRMKKNAGYYFNET
ncbi:MAG: capsular exopolysaccharide synthesis family protein [Alphaproteobacteria bacterium]|jgi:capsular exopolysaccharide synthesis family protein